MDYDRQCVWKRETLLQKLESQSPRPLKQRCICQVFWPKMLHVSARLSSRVHCTGTEQDKLKDGCFYNGLISSESRCHQRFKGKGRGKCRRHDTGTGLTVCWFGRKAARPHFETSREYGHGPGQVTESGSC